MQFEDNEDEEYIKELIRQGYIYPVGFDNEGEILYQSTEKFRKQFPEMFAEQIAETNRIMYDLWMLGLVDITVKEEINDWVVYPNKQTFECDLDELTTEQRNIIVQLRYRTEKAGNDTI